MSNSSNVTRSSSFTLPIANSRKIFSTEQVEKRAHHLQEMQTHDYDTQLWMYLNMIERGPERYQVKPSGVPAMEHLYLELPNFKDALDDIQRSIALSVDAPDGLEIIPLLLLGDPGIGKTHFARKIAELIGTKMTLIPMSSMTAGWLLSGASSQWKGSKPGKVFETLINGDYANPVIIVDEIDKVASDAQYDPLGALYNLLEHDSASSFTDEFAEVPIDASQVIWITTANDERFIPKPILNRMNVFHIDPPNNEASRTIARNLYRTIRLEHGWGKHFDEDIHDTVLDILMSIVPRKMRTVLMTGFGNARLRGRYFIEPKDLPDTSHKKNSIGFIQ